MDIIVWRPTLKLFPAQLQDIRQAFDNHVKENLNKFVSSFRGLLLNVDKASLKLTPSTISSDNPAADRSCFVHIYPDLSYISLKVEVTATVFCPVIGQCFEATVFLVKRFFFVCKFGSPSSVSVTIPISEAGIFADNNGSNVEMTVGDIVEVEITKIIRSVSNMILHGKLCRIIDVKTKNSAIVDSTLTAPSAKTNKENDEKESRMTRKKNKKDMLVSKLENPMKIPVKVEKHRKKKIKSDHNSLKEPSNEFVQHIKSEPTVDAAVEFRNSNESPPMSTISSPQDDNFVSNKLFPLASSFIKSEPDPSPNIKKKWNRALSPDLFADSDENIETTAYVTKPESL